MNTPEQVKPSSSGLPIGTHAPPDVDLIGSNIGKYHVVRKLGEGGMGAVFEAVHSEIGQRAAIKVLHPHLTQQPKFVRRFVDEARLISMVGHPGLVKIYDFTTTPTAAQCIVMEFLVGESLFSRLRRAKEKATPGTPIIQIAEVLQVTRHVASALAAVHGRGIIHRDLKPENIMLVADPDSPTGVRAKILDFGIACLDAPDGGRHTTSGVSLGTPTYMAPEQIEGVISPTDRIDVYALGVIVFELLSGEPPFQSQTTGGVLRQHLIKEPPPLPQHVPAEVQTLVREALQKDPASRPSMAQFVERIDALTGGQRVSTALHVVSPLSREVSVVSAPSWPRLIYLGASVLVVLSLVALVVLLSRRASGPTVQPTPPVVASPQPETPPIQKTTPPPPPERTVPGAQPAGRDVVATPPKKSPPRGEGKTRPAKGMRFGDLPRNSSK